MGSSLRGRGTELKSSVSSCGEQERASLANARLRASASEYSLHEVVSPAFGRGVFTRRPLNDFVQSRDKSDRAVVLLRLAMALTECRRGKVTPWVVAITGCCRSVLTGI